MSTASTPQAGAIETLRKGFAEIPVFTQGLWLTWIFAAMGAAGRIVTPIIVQQAIDRGIVVGVDGGPTTVNVTVVATLAGCGAVAVLVSSFGQRQALFRLGQRAHLALAQLRRRLVAHIHRLSIADHNEEHRGALVARVTGDIESLANFFRWGAFAWLIDTTLMLIVAIAMLIYDWQLALIALAFAVPLFIILRFLQTFLLRAYDTARKRNGDMVANVGELVTGAKTIRAYGASDWFGRRARDAVDLRVKTQTRGNIIGAFMFPTGELFSVITVATIITVGVTTGPDRGLTAGALVGFIFLTVRFLEPVAMFTEVLDQTQTAVAGFRRVIDVLDLPVEPKPPVNPVDLPPGGLSVEFDAVSFSYRSRPDGSSHDEDDPLVLNSVSATIPAGQQVALVGATGSGKTTLGRLIARYADPVGGEVRLGGVPLDRVDNTQLRERLVVVAQEPFLFNDTILANIQFARPDVTEDEIDALLKMLDIDDWVAGLPHGLHTTVGQRGESLSAGERQLIALVRAGIADPDVLLLDEATSSVDALTEVRISRALQRLAQGRTTISIAHRLSTAARADRVMVLDHGVLVEDGAHDQLIAAGGTYRRLFDAWLAATAAG